MRNIRNLDQNRKTYTAFDGKSYYSSSQGDQLATPLDIALYRSSRRVLEGYRDEG